MLSNFCVAEEKTAYKMLLGRVNCQRFASSLDKTLKFFFFLCKKFIICLFFFFFLVRQRQLGGLGAEIQILVLSVRIQEMRIYPQMTAFNKIYITLSIQSSLIQFNTTFLGQQERILRNVRYVYKSKFFRFPYWFCLNLRNNINQSIL